MCRAQVGDPYMVFEYEIEHNGVREEARALFSRGAGNGEYRALVDRLNQDRQRASAIAATGLVRTPHLPRSIRRPRFRPSVIR